ncbi:MAG: PD-(D/E)XK nuclease family protein [Bdellovibrionales bacterium]|nr:PD-(D/E)XK nuclease family protein [Bdellovibrionales bacterium]
MFQFHYVSSQLDRFKLFSQFDSKRQTWLVADLTSKFEIQKEIIQREKLLEEDAVLRAAEFWQKIIYRQFPQVKIVSQHFISEKVKQILSNMDIEWAQKPGSASTVLKYLNQLSSVLFHPNGSEVLQEWLENNPLAKVRWGHWAILCMKVMDQLRNENIILVNWISGYLLSQELDSITWDREIIVDLGQDLSFIELELLSQISNSANRTIKIVVEEGKFNEFYRELISPYKQIDDRKVDDTTSEFLLTDSLERLFEKVEDTQVFKFSTYSAEVKDLCFKIRGLVEEGHKMSDIIIAGPEMESYWPVLAPYLRQEGIVYNKSKITRVSSFPSIQSWLAHLRLSLKLVSKEDLEWSLTEKEFSFLRYEDFKRLFSVLFKEEDLGRNEEMSSLYAQTVSKDFTEGFLRRNEFIAWALVRLPKHLNLDIVQGIFNQIFSDCREETSLTLRSWVSYLEAICSKKEIRLEDEFYKPYGVRIENLNSLSFLKMQFLFVLGLSESEMKTMHRTAISASDVFSFRQQTGLIIEQAENRTEEYNLVKTLNYIPAKKYLYISHTDFKGNDQSIARLPLLFSFYKKIDLSKTQSAQMSFWDSLQRQELKTIGEFRGWSDQSIDIVESKLKGDLDSRAQDNFYVPKDISLSASRMESYLKCPFKFFSEKILGLFDLPIVDLDIDKLSSGKLMHKIFERLIYQVESSLSDEELKELIRRSAAEVGALSADQRVFDLQIQSYVELANRFIEFESGWRKEHPSSKVLKTEHKIHVYWDRDQKKWFKSPAEGRIPLIGYIDRIDGDGEGALIVIDYKSSPGALRYFKDWVDKGNLQLAIYSQALEQEDEQNEVVGACYYVAKDFNRSRGFQLEAGSSKKLLPESTRYNKVDRVQLDKLYEEINGLVGEVVTGITELRFSPVPKDFDECHSCQWSQLCRASHLN